MTHWEDTLFELVTRASTDLPGDVEAALRCARDREDSPNAKAALATMLENAELARVRRAPICQDTGAILFWVSAPCAGLSQAAFRTAAEAAICRATAAGVLRQNCVEALSGRNTGTNIGRGSPVIHWEETAGETVSVRLLLKGGGCENVGAQYALPDSRLAAGRDLDGVRRCVLDAVVAAQGMGCAPGVLGVVIGGDRATGYAASKEQFLRRFGERSPDPELAALERRLLEEGNRLRVGPMGYGGRTTLLEVFCDWRCRLPASYFVSVSYMCWAYRRQRLTAWPDGTVLAWE